MVQKTLIRDKSYRISYKLFKSPFLLLKSNWLQSWIKKTGVEIQVAFEAVPRLRPHQVHVPGGQKPRLLALGGPGGAGLCRLLLPQRQLLLSDVWWEVLAGERARKAEGQRKCQDLPKKRGHGEKVGEPGGSP